MMLRTLLKKQIGEIFRSYFYDAKKNKARSFAQTIAFTALFVLLMVGLLGGVFAYLAYSMCAPLADVGMSWFYFTILSLIAIALGVFGSVFNTYSGLYLAKDNDLLLSMPIPTGVIIASRLLAVYLMGLMYSAIVIVPAVIVYFIVVPLTFSAVVGSILLIIDISIFVLILSCLLGLVVAKISVKLKNKSFITVFISLIAIAAYYFVYYKAQAWISELVSGAAVYGEKLRGKAYPLYLLGRTGVGDVTAMIIITASVAVLFGLTWLVLSKSFTGIATSVSTSSVSKSRIKEKAAHRKSPGAALLGREFARFTASPNYMLNCGLGILFIPIIGVLLLVKGSALVETINDALGVGYNFPAVLACAAACAAASMNDMTAPSVSLEGKTLPITQSLPINPWHILRAKLLMQTILTDIPLIFCSVCILAAVPCDIPTAVLTLLIPLLFSAFSACLGLALGLKRPNLTWTSEIMAVKQGLAVMITLFGGMIYSLAIGVIYFIGGFNIGATIYLSAVAAITAAATIPLFIWIKKKGSKIYSEL